MPRTNYSLIVFLLLLGGCATDNKVSYVPGQSIVDPCPSEGLADVQSAPKYPIVQPDEANVVYTAIANAVGNDRAQTIIRYWESELQSWGKLGWYRVNKVRDWCIARNLPSQ